MLRSRFSKHLGSTLVACGLFAIASTSHAHGAFESYPQAAGKKTASAACESARQSARFERQRQMTDGDTNPFQPIANPRECDAMRSSNVENEAASRMAASGQANARPAYSGAPAAAR